MSAGQWEVVTNKSKKQKNNANGYNRNHKVENKRNMENMPKLEDVAPIQESQTMFDVFLDQERKRSQIQSKINGSAGATKSRDNVHQKKKVVEKKKNQPQTLNKPLSIEEAIENLNVEQMETFLATVEARFPDSPKVWLTDMTSYLNLKLNVEITDPVFSSKAIGYPSSLASTKLCELIINTLNRCAMSTLQLFFEFCIKSLIQDTTKGLPTFGYRIFLQCLAQEMPSVALENLSKCVDSRNSCQNRQNVCLSLLWAVGQAGNNDLNAGLKVWLELMFPVIGMKAYTKFVVEYLEKLLRSHEKSTSAKIVLGVKELFPVLDFVHSCSSGIAPNLQKRLQMLYPKLKALSYGDDENSVLRNYFPSYLRRLEPKCSLSLREEVLGSLVECLTKDRQTYSIWRQLYVKHLVQSSLLMAHLLKHWNGLPSQFPRKLLLETLSTFRVTNEELMVQEKTIQSLNDCVLYCNDLMAKMSAQRFPWGKLLIFLVLAICTLLAYDINIHGTFKGSKTGNFLKDAGLLAICEQAWGRITVYSEKSIKWLNVNVPVFCSWLSKTCGPYLENFWKKLFELSLSLWNCTQGIRAWVNSNLPPFLEIVNDNLPYYSSKLSRHIESVVLFVLRQTATIWEFLGHYLTKLILWLHTNVLTGSFSPENLQHFIGQGVELLQYYTVTTYQWISHNVLSCINTGK